MGKWYARALLAAGPLLVIACGRWGYDPRPLEDLDGGAGIDASGPISDAGLLIGCLEVTTASDENDPGERPVPPHAGAGLSLHEAILIANQVPGDDCIGFAGAMDVTIATSLPTITEQLTIDGQGVVTVTGTPAVGFAIESGATHLQNLVIGNFDTCVDVLAGSAELSGVEMFDCKTRAVRSAVSGLVVKSSLIREGGDGVVLGASTSGHLLEQTLIYNCADGIVARGVLGLTLRHMTVVQNRFYGLDGALLGDNIDIVNSIVFDNGTADVRVDTPENAIIEYSLLDAGKCTGCTPGTGSITGDPMFTDPLVFDYTLAPGSPAIDSGTDTGLDVNGSTAGLYNGDAPDMGAFESP